MHRLRTLSLVLSLCLVAACGGPAAPTPMTPPIGVSGATLSGTLSVVVVDEESGAPIAGASVDTGGAAVQTSATGAASLPATGSVTLTVRAAGYVVEHWVGVDRETAGVALARPLVSRTIAAAVTGGTEDVVVSAATALTILRTSSPFVSAAACVGGACDASLVVEGDAGDLDVVVSNGTLVRLGTGLGADASGHLALDVGSLTESERLIAAPVTLPTDPGLEGVVGVPGLVTGHGVALLPFPSPTATSMQIPAREGPLADARVWYVVRGTTADGSGDSAMFDRDVDHDGTVRLPSTFLAVPAATASGTVGIDVDPEADLYVVEAFSGVTAERTLVLRPGGAHLDLPIDLSAASRVVVRAIDTNVGLYGVDLDTAESEATRIASIEL